MDDISKSDDAPPHVITKHTQHWSRELLLGHVTGVHWLGEHLVLYYADGHKALVSVDDDGDIVVEDYEVPEC